MAQVSGGHGLKCNFRSPSILLTIPLAANLADSTAGELTLELAALLALGTGVVLAGEGLGLGVAAWLPDGDSQILRVYAFGPSGLKDYGSAILRCKI